MRCWATSPTASRWSATSSANSTAARSGNGACANSPKSAGRAGEGEAVTARPDAAGGHAKISLVSRTGRVSRASRNWPRWSVPARRSASAAITSRGCRSRCCAPSAGAASRFALRLLGRRAAARTASGGGGGRGDRHLLFQPRHLRSAAAFPRRRRGPAPCQCATGPRSPVIQALRAYAAEPAVDAVPAS